MSPPEDRKRMAADPSLPTLPTEYAFVVQFNRETDERSGRLVGQVEHLASARQARFGNREEMLAFIEDTLATIARRGRS